MQGKELEKFPSYIYLETLPGTTKEEQGRVGSIVLKAALEGYNGGNVDVGKLHMGVVQAGDVQAIVVGMELADDSRLGDKHREHRDYAIITDRKPASDVSAQDLAAMNVQLEAPFLVVGVLETADGTPRIIGMQKFSDSGSDIVMVSHS